MKWFFTLILLSFGLFASAQKKLSFVRPSDTDAKTLFEYKGEVTEGKANGYGEATSKAGISYEGYWKDNDFNGKGILSKDQVVEYEGDFVNGRMEGKGKRVYYADTKYEVKYEGDFVDGWQTGYGIKIYKDGRKEEGYFKENEFKGTTLSATSAPAPTAAAPATTDKQSLVFRIPYYNNSSIELMVSYYGTVKNGQAEGEGKADIMWLDNYTGNKPFATYYGDWKNNNFHGKGELIYVAGSSYKGDFVNGQPHGKGIDKFEGGGNYTGDFVNGKRQGYGVTTYSDGSKKEGQWYDNQFRGDGNTIPKEYVKEKTAEDRAWEAEEKAREAKEAQAKLEKEKDAKDPCKMGWNVYGFKRGLTRMHNGAYVILDAFDCKKDEYKVWRPAQKSPLGNDMVLNMSYTVAGDDFRQFSYEPDKYWYTCTACDGDGTKEITVYTTKTKELPWGYFSGIETKRISTTSKTYTQLCDVCKGAAVLLKKK